ncbi:fimbrial protein [Bordetella petrii]|uniref:fimbrial protein n=1 Tax=Bordetella petrii TaxID=94624 RepID=UPI001A97C061|nr:fimbrial protein [Bordetella petrii]MBO1112491.1 fimbrial protein [Bordetella petrii]
MPRFSVFTLSGVMTLRNLPRKRMSRPLSAALLACNMALGACATLEPPAADHAAPAPAAPAAAAPAPARPPARYDWNEIERAARQGISVLAPAQPLPVAPAALSESRELDLDPMPCRLTPAEGLTDASLQPPAGLADAAQRPPGPDATGTIDAPIDAGTAAAALPIQCANLFPDVAPVPPQDYAFGLETRDPVPYGSVMVVTGVAQPANPWFSSVGSQQGFSYGGGRWTYRDTAGPTVALGNLTANAPIWGSAVPIGGLQVADWAGGAQQVPQGRLAYSSTVGVLNYTDTAAQSGAIDYGVTAGSGALRYGLTPALTLESQMQSAPDLSTRGLGSTYSAGELGTFQAGATQSSFDHINAWRYRFGYNVSLFESVSLAVTNEQIGAGFGDLSQYRNGAAAAPQMRNTLAAGVPILGWGTLTGTYTGLRESGEAIEQRFGLEHSMLVAPSVRLAVGADRDVVTGDYEMRAGVTMPVDAFVRGRWLPW